MIAATLTLLAFLVFGGAGAAGWATLAQKEASTTIEDSSRAKDAKRILKEMGKKLAEHEKAVLALRQELYDVEFDYDSTEADYTAVFRKLDQTWVDTELDLIRLRTELLQYMTADEWRELNDRVDARLDEIAAKAQKKADKKAKKQAKKAAG